MKTDILEKYSMPTYVLILIFSILFYFLLWGASGHKLNIQLTEILGLIFMLFGIIIVPNYKSKRINKTKKLIQILSLLISVETIIPGIVVLIYLFGFKFGDDISPIAIVLFYLVPLVFIIANGTIIKGILTELRK
ncbi:hypothetical protein [uncultured Dokdonia sp.]|uniref:hypothetical protein n=1 Tax=uncultured Dokdonia sp. TaxID=575653 RepID=UPI00262F94F9|nr:hypothetical protein [uncultured Dokdonia sp.]